MARTKTYDPKKLILTLNGLALVVGGETAMIDFEMASPAASDVVSATGDVTINRSADERMYATITVMETSNAARVLDQLRQAQAAQPFILPMPFVLLDPISGDTVSDPEAAFLEIPGPSKASTAGEREFKLVLPHGRNTMRLATLSVG
jgi:hypothetical protein